MMQSQTTWQETVVLPVGYIEEGNGRVHRDATLRKMTGNEEALLADPKLRGNGGKLITALLGACVTALDEVEKINPAVIRRLFSADRNYLLLELRRLTFGDEMEAHYRCPCCQGVTAVLEDLAALEIRRVDDNDTSPEISVTLQDGYRDPDGNWQHELVFVLPTGEDEEAAGSRRDGNPARQRDALLARCLKQVGDLEARRIHAMGIRILAELSMSDRRLIQKALDDAAPGPDLTRQVVCDHCGEEYRTTLDMSHFFPLG
jgi:hypothetical protein